jgi:hypothetical protein
LQQAGLIKYRRGHIHSVDVDGLRDAAGQATRPSKSHSGRLLGGASVRHGQLAVFTGSVSVGLWGALWPCIFKNK